jgi:hypothetical protein
MNAWGPGGEVRKTTGREGGHEVGQSTGVTASVREHGGMCLHVPWWGDNDKPHSFGGDCPGY